MTTRAWHIVRWFGFLAIGLGIAVGAGVRYRQAPADQDAFLPATPTGTALAAEAPRPWLAREEDEQPFARPTPPSLTESTPDLRSRPDGPAPFDALDPDSPEAEREIDELGLALAGFDVENVQLSALDEGGRRRFVFSCDVPTSRGAQTFAGEGPDPPSAARHALGRIRAWASAGDDTTLR